MSSQDTNSIEELIIVSALWAICTVLYYFLGKKKGRIHGYAKGFDDGFVSGVRSIFPKGKKL